MRLKLRIVVVASTFSVLLACAPKEAAPPATEDAKVPQEAVHLIEYATGFCAETTNLAQETGGFAEDVGNLLAKFTTANDFAEDTANATEVAE